ncbi:MAG: hypothetical protein QXJ64_09695 [Thermosphaera sp.]
MTLSLSQHAVLELVKNYIQSTKRTAFTYNSIKWFAARTGFYRRYDISDRTIDRTLRKLAELGFFNRKKLRVRDYKTGRLKKIVVYTPTRLFYQHKEARAEKVGA